MSELGQPGILDTRHVETVHTHGHGSGRYVQSEAGMSACDTDVSRTESARQFSFWLSLALAVF